MQTNQEISDGITELTSKGERTQAVIIEAAHNLFLKNGYHGTSMRQVAQEAGIAVGGIYNHFPGKEQLFKAVLLAYHPYKQVLPAMLNASGSSAGEIVHDAAHRMVAEFQRRNDFINLMFIELVEFNAQHIPELYDAVFPQVQLFTERLMADKEDLRPIPIPLLLRAFIGLFFSYVITELLMKERLDPALSQVSLDYFVDIFLHGILAKP